MRLLSSCLLVATILLTATVSDAAQRLGQGSGGPVVKEEWIALEAEANEAEKAGKWTQAANLYRQAANLARNRGQFQRAIEYGSKSLQSAEKAKAPAQEINANLELALAYRSVAQNSKARDHLVKSVELLKLVPAGNNKINLETRVYGELGGEFVRSKEYEHAIEYIGYSLQRQDAQLTFLERTANRNGQAIKGIKTRMGRTLEMLGDAHNAAGHVEEAAKGYERGLGINKDAGLTSGMVRIQLGLGQLYFRRNDFPRALENFQKALDSAENLGYGQGIQRASSQIGNLLRRTNKSSEAIPYYEKAIARIELTRAGLESEEFRTGFFENTVNTYASMIRAQLQQKNLDDAFNYNERARSRAFRRRIAAWTS